MFFNPNLVNQPAYYETSWLNVPADYAVAHPPKEGGWRPNGGFNVLSPDGRPFYRFNCIRLNNVYNQVIYS
jgi:hypothetical protein